MIETLDKVIDQETFVDYLTYLSTQWREMPELGMVTREPSERMREMAGSLGIEGERLTAFFAAAYNRGLACAPVCTSGATPKNHWQEVADVVWTGVYYE